MRQSDNSQSTTSNRRYDAFGVELAASGTQAGKLGFAGTWGYQEDTDSGLRLLGHRYYDSSTGRFLSRDDAKDGRNWYCYAESNPLLFVDPSGLAVFVGLKAGFLLLLGIEAEAGIVIGEKGEIGVRLKYKMSIGAGGEGEIGVTGKWEDDPPVGGTRGIGPFDETDLTIGPVDVGFSEVGDPPSIGLTWPQGGGSIGTSLWGKQHTLLLPVRAQDFLHGPDLPEGIERIYPSDDNFKRFFRVPPYV